MHISRTLIASGLVVLLAVASAHAATPTDSATTWSVAAPVHTINQFADNSTGVAFANSDGTVRTYWPNSAGQDVCKGASQLMLSRARTNYQDIVQVITSAGLSGKLVHVWYEVIGGVCYIKGASLKIQ